MEKSIINKIAAFLNPNSEIDLSGVPATDDEISNAEETLGLKFHEDYKDFIKKFGGVYAGIPIYAFNNNEMMSNDTIIDLTKSFRIDYEDDNRSKIINESYVISFDGSGNPIMINLDGQAIIFYHDSEEYKILSDSLSNLIEDIIDGNLENEF